MDSLAEAVRTSGLDERKRSWLSQLLVVRSCAYLEQTALTVVRHYINAKSGGTVKTFAGSWLHKGNIPSTDNLKQLVGRFDQAWALELDVVLKSNNEKLHLDLAFLIACRHQISHDQSVSVPPIRALELKASTVLIANWLIVRFNPAPP